MKRVADSTSSLRLESRFSSLGDEPERVVEAASVEHHRRKTHLVVWTLGPPMPLPSRVEEDGYPFQKPSRRRAPRRRQEHVADRLGMFRDGRDLAPEQVPEHPVARCARSMVPTCTSSWFHQIRNAFAGRERLKGEVIGAIRSDRKFLGTASAEALPASEKVRDEDRDLSLDVKSNSF